MKRWWYFPIICYFYLTRDFQFSMSPDSNIENINKNISENVSDVPYLNYIVSTEDSSHIDSTTSEDDDDSYQTEYAGYQLLSQDNLSSDNESEETKVDVDNDDLHTAVKNSDICIDYQVNNFDICISAKVQSSL